VVVGDAMARPLVDELVANRDRRELSSLVVVASGGAILSPATKARLAEVLPGRIIIDGFGSSETGTLGNKSGVGAGAFRVNEETAVLDDTLRPVVPGSGVVGRLARRGHIPLRYNRDAKKTAETFVNVGGVRWSLPGDLATVEADGSVTLLGRGSTCINTGGEKVFPEEVESTVKAHSAVVDAVVAGAADERWGERVVAVVALREGATLTLEELQGFCRDQLAGYKVPRALVVVPEVMRSPAGKADYRWARQRAAESTNSP
jgi:3-oxocholest-4-en-26-oate---CoA ligase